MGGVTWSKVPFYTLPEAPLNYDPAQKDYDHYGWRPPGLNVATTDIWTAANMDQSLLQPPPVQYGNNGSFKMPSFVEDPLHGFGPTDVFLKVNPKNPAQYDQIKNAVSSDPDPSNTNFNPEVVCTPFTFPNCSMQYMANSVPEFPMWDGTSVNYMERYAQAITDGYERAYVSGGFDAMQDINTHDTTEYDPCGAPSLFEVLFPAVTAIVLTAGFSRYAGPAVAEAVDTTTAALMTPCVFMASFSYASGILGALGPAGPFYQRTAFWLTLPFKNYIAMQISNTLVNTSFLASFSPLALQIGALGVIVYFTVSVDVWLGKIVGIPGFVGALVTRTFRFLTNGLNRFICLLTNNMVDACEAKSSSKDNMQFTYDTRRWDVMGVAGMLTDEVREREHWSRDDPRSEYVFRGLATNPSMMAVDDVNNSGTTIYQNNPFGSSPLGPIYSYYSTNNLHDGVWQYGKQRICGWDGACSGIWDNASADRYACQNWGIMRFAKDTFAPDPGMGRVARKFDGWIGNWEKDTIGQGVLKSVADPSNLGRMHRIPGMPGNTGGPVDCAEYVRDVYLTQDPVNRAKTAQAALDSSDAECESWQIPWLKANVAFYEWLAAQSEPWKLTLDDAYKASKTFFAGFASPKQLSAAWWAVSAVEIPISHDLFLWQTAPSAELYEMIMAYPPPESLPAGDFQNPALSNQPAPAGVATVLGASSFGARYSAAAPMASTDLKWMIWFLTNVEVYAWLTRNVTQKPLQAATLSDLGNNIEGIASWYGREPDLVLYALAAVPTSPEARPSFNSFFQNINDPAVFMQPQGAPPPEYPPSAYTAHNAPPPPPPPITNPFQPLGPPQYPPGLLQAYNSIMNAGILIQRGQAAKQYYDVYIKEPSPNPNVAFWFFANFVVYQYYFGMLGGGMPPPPDRIASVLDQIFSSNGVTLTPEKKDQVWYAIAGIPTDAGNPLASFNLCWKPGSYNDIAATIHTKPPREFPPSLFKGPAALFGSDEYGGPVLPPPPAYPPALIPASGLTGLGPPHWLSQILSF